MLSPPAFFAWLAGLPRNRDTCIECGAGQGEIAAFLGRYFRRAIASDVAPRAARLTAARGTRAVCAAAEALPLGAESADLVVSLQALHHFDAPLHLSEASRVLRPGGIFAALSWGEIRLPPDVAAAYAPTFRMLAGHWEAERDWVVSGYAGLALSGTPVPLPPAALSRALTLETLAREVAGWSAVRTALRRKAEVPDPKEAGLARGRRERFVVSWPLCGLAFRR